MNVPKSIKRVLSLRERSGQLPVGPPTPRITVRLKRLHDKRERSTVYFHVYILLAVAFVGGAFLEGLKSTAKTGIDGRPVRIAAFAVYAAIAVVAALVNRIRLRLLEEEIRQIEFADDIQRFGVSLTESWALKLLGVQEDRLRRYYELNLSQGAWVFFVGLLSLLGGFVLIAGTLIFVRRLYLDQTTRPDKETVEIIVALLGGLGALAAQVVAAVYLRMNVSIAANLQTLHARLADTHQLFFANWLATRVRPEEQSTTWAAMALALTRLHHTEPASLEMEASDLPSGGAARKTPELAEVGKELVKDAPSKPKQDIPRPP